MRGFTTNTRHLKCVVCSSGFYLTQLYTCFKGNVENCEKYKLNSPLGCLACDSRRYYLLDGRCLEHKEILYCTNYSQGEKNLCEKCNKESLMIDHTNGCERVNIPIDNCMVYESEQLCRECEDSYFLNKF